MSSDEKTGSAYRVLARKYRPQSFEDLIGQEPMVRTLRNAFATHRIHQAYIFTGVRGVGKTTTARILARALNYETESIKAPQIDMPALGLHCEAIMESRHVDVIEMDAASNTSISNIREIIEAARYKPVSARTKVYIIDEVHMLSNAAFNGLLKTLEEPPPHVKFLFATTEIRKVPVTVLSRCQRFDLRRIESGDMIAYLERVIAKEGVKVDPEALALVARASEGSMRDALSLLDQAIAHGGGHVNADEVRAALGLADRARVIDLFEAVMGGDIARALQEFAQQHHEGAEPSAILTDLAEFVHIVTRLKLVPDAEKDSALTEGERVRGAAFAKVVPIRALTMAWQILLKGVQEVQQASRPKMAGEMVLVRLAYASELPNPADLIRDIRSGALPGGSGPAPGGGSPGGTQARAVGESPHLRAIAASPQPSGHPTTALRAQPQAMPDNLPKTYGEIVALAREHRDIRMETALKREIRVIAFEPGRIEILPTERADADLSNRLAKALIDWTGYRWGVVIARDTPESRAIPTIHETEEEQKREEERQLALHPAVKAVLDHFPGAQIIDIRQPQVQAEAPPEVEEDAEFDPLSVTDEDL